MFEFIKRNLLIFLILLFLVVLLQFLLFQPALKLGITQDDWVMLDSFKILGPNPLSRISYVLNTFGPHFTQEYWIGFLTNIFGWQNTVMLREANIGIKILETLVLYIVVLVIFKRKLLAFLSAIVYAIHYSTLGSLEHIISGVDYLVGLFMLIFFAVYHHIAKNKILNFRWLILLLLSLITTLLFEPVRAFPVLIAPFLIEALLLVHNHSKIGLKYNLSRLLMLLPICLLIFILMLVLDNKGFRGGTTVGIPHALTSILDGNWYYILHPLASLSNLFLPLVYLHQIFGIEILVLDDLFTNYVLFLVTKTIIFFGILTCFFSFFIRPPRWGKGKFILITLVMNFILDILVFIVYNHRYDNLPDYLKPSELAGIYPILFGMFLLILNSWIIYGWWKDKKNILFLAFWSGFIFSLIYILLVRLMADELFAYQIYHRYLLIPTLGASLSLASFLVLIYDKIACQTFMLSKSWGSILIFVIIMIFYRNSNQITSDYWYGLINNGEGAQLQEILHQRFLDKFSTYKVDPHKPAFFFFDASEESEQDKIRFGNSFGNFMSWMDFINKIPPEVCFRNMIDTQDALRELIRIKNGEKGIESVAFCRNYKDGSYNDTPTFFELENFYSFKVKNLEFIDNRDEVLKKLEFNN